MDSKILIAGIGITNFGKFIDKTVRNLAEEAVNKALQDARIQSRDVEIIFFGNATSGLITGQEMIRGQAALRNCGFGNTPIVNVENACASSSTAFYLAHNAIKSGAVEIALVVGAEKMTHHDKKVSMGAFSAAVDLEEPVPSYIGKGSGSIFMDIYAEKTRKFMKERNATPEDFARVVVKSRIAGSLNPIAQFKEQTTIEEVLSARKISDPLTLPMCSAIGDGAAAIVLMSDRIASKLSIPKPVWVGSTVLISGDDLSDSIPCASKVSLKVFNSAGVSPSDVHVVELHDATAPAELMHYENLMLCGPGESISLIRSGDTNINGRVSVNPSGGLLSRGHPIGATGAAQLVELTSQLRGTAGKRQRVGARVGLAENNGGQIGSDAAVASATIIYT